MELQNDRITEQTWQIQYSRTFSKWGYNNDLWFNDISTHEDHLHQYCMANSLENLGKNKYYIYPKYSDTSIP